MNKRLRRNILLLGMVVCTSFFTGCSNKEGYEASSTQEGPVVADTNQSDEIVHSQIAAIEEVVSYDEDDYYSSWEETEATIIDLKNNQISYEGSGVKVEGSKVTIEKAGTYVISGTLTDGNIIVNAEDKKTVRLILNGVDINCSTSAPLYVQQAGKVVLSLEEGTTNRFTDGENYVLEDASSDEPNAAIFSKDDLTINGKGSLEVIANYNNGITSKDTLKIVEGTLKVTAVDDGIMGKDAVMIKSADVKVTAEGDGIKATNDTDEAKGFIGIEDGNFNIVAGADGIQAATDIYIEEGHYTIQTGGGSANAVKKQNETMGHMGRGQAKTSVGADSTQTTVLAESTSYKGIKGSNTIYMSGGTLVLDTADDSIHSNDRVVITGGEISIASGDDGIHANTQLDIEGGTLNITKSYEGLESSQMNIKAGEITVVASDDGINVAGGNDTNTTSTGFGKDQFTHTENGLLTITGGTIFVDASGDGLDANGSIEMSGGTVIVSGPTNDGNGSLDYDGSFNITGGVLIATGSAGMMQTPSNSSTQASIAMTYADEKSAGELVHIEDGSGNTILTFEPSKNYRSVVISTPEIKTGESYSYYSEGSIIGDNMNGLYTDVATYTKSGEAITFTIADRVTYLSETGVTTGNNNFGPGGNGGGGRGNRPNRGAAADDNAIAPPTMPDDSNRPVPPENQTPVLDQNSKLQ